MREQLPDIAAFFIETGGLDVRIDVALEEAQCLTRPLRIYYGIEPRCNLTCSFCGPRDFQNRGVKVSPQKESFLINQIAEAGAFQVQFTGGEVGMRGFDLIPVLEEARACGLAVILSTNGVWHCIDNKEDFIESLSRLGNIIQVKISIEGQPGFHDFGSREGNIRGGGEHPEPPKQVRVKPQDQHNNLP